MKLVSLAALVLLVAGTLCWSSGALADSPDSDAAHMCLDGPQTDYYQVVNATDTSPPLDFGDLVHGSDSTGPYIVAQNHGDCVSFAAKNSKGAGSKKQEVFIQYTFTQLIVTG